MVQIAEASDRQAILTQNLMDAGCDSKTICVCMNLAREGRREQLLQTLAAQKGALLDLVHQNQRRIDCLDFLVYQIERGNVIGQTVKKEDLNESSL